VSNRGQKYLLLAAEQVKKVRGTEAADIYGGLCHNFPIMVRSLGLCQTLAYYESKMVGKDKNRTEAYSQKLSDVHAITDIGTDKVLSTYAASLPVLEYMQLTRNILDASIYFKRFAVSLLKVDSASQVDEE
jgi:CRISPR-associated protein Cmr5